jgi:hypothetical protein
MHHAGNAEKVQGGDIFPRHENMPVSGAECPRLESEQVGADAGLKLSIVGLQQASGLSWACCTLGRYRPACMHAARPLSER